MAATTKVLVLKGDPKNPESAEHIIKFPGGSVSVARTTDNEYWAHIEVNHPKQGQIIDETIRETKFGEVVAGRIDRTYPKGVEDLDVEDLYHIAIRIRTRS